MAFHNAKSIRERIKAEIETDLVGRPPDGSESKQRTQTRFAKRLRISQSYLSQFLSGERKSPSRKLLRGLGLDPEPFWREK